MPEKKDFILIFKTEMEERLAKLDKGLVELEKDTNNLELLKGLNMEAHTIKGAARVIGCFEIQDIAHRIEDVFDEIAHKKLIFNSSVAQIIFKGFDTIRFALEKVLKDEKADVSGICSELEGWLSGKAKDKNKKLEVAKQPDEETAEQEKEDLREAKDESRSITVKQETQEQLRKEENVTHEEYVRVPINRVDRLLNLVGEMVINKVKSSQKINQAKRLSRSTKEVQKKISVLSEKIKSKISQEDGENGEIGRLLSECNVNIERLKEEFMGLYESISSETYRLDLVVDELQSRMKEIRMHPLSIIFEGFPRMVRDIAFQQKKKVALEINGKETELDRKVLELIKVPLIHILRNCIDHGIEDDDSRKVLGKPRHGTIKISASHKAGNVVIVIEDDGRGIDIEEIKQSAVKKQLVSHDELEMMTDSEVKNIVFMNGYSTSPIITDVSGRGVGLDVVRHDIENLKGQIILDTEKDKGTTFTLILPLTIAIIKVLLIKTQGLIFAVPIISVAESLDLDGKEIFTIEGKMAIQVQGHTIPIVKLHEVLGIPFMLAEDEENKDQSSKISKDKSLIIIDSLEKRVGFVVDEIVGEEEIFIKSLGNHLGKIKNVSGATILGTGEVVVILDVVDLITQSALSYSRGMGRKKMVKNKKEKRILVVEDNLSTRELEKSMLEAQGYLVNTAVDGLDGLDKITTGKYDLIVSDVKMPRMDGFDFCEKVKNNDEYKDIPVIIVTSLEKEEDKRRGIEVGAAAYILKKAFDQMNLLDTIERLIGR